MAVFSKKDEKIKAVFAAMVDINDMNEFKAKFKEMYPRESGVLLPLVFLVLIEITQYITEPGIAEFDDVFGNTLGG